MPVFRLPDDPLFPPPDLAEQNGLLAVGGDLSERRLLTAYSMGIFPWYSEGDPILWWSPDPRLVLFPGEFRISRSLRQAIKKQTFTITMDTAFEEVIHACAAVHDKKAGDTWITEDMIKAYTGLHRSGFAHSVETWSDGQLAGGLYGVSLGAAFFGESMFTRQSNASKVAFAALVQYLNHRGVSLIDCQMTTPHLLSLGAREVPRNEFMELLHSALNRRTLRGQWRFTEDLMRS
jgi:leucyl/phenylalanyl-tRNA--protein transferase